MGHTSSRNKEVHRRAGTARMRRSQPMSRKARRKRDRLMTKPHAEAARSIGFRLVVCCLCLDLTRLDARTLGVRYSWDRPQSIEASSSCSEGSSALRLSLCNRVSRPLAVVVPKPNVCTTYVYMDGCVTGHRRSVFRLCRRGSRATADSPAQYSASGRDSLPGPLG